jgi:hypothetical protein
MEREDDCGSRNQVVCLKATEELRPHSHPLLRESKSTVQRH